MTPRDVLALLPATVTELVDATNKPRATVAKLLAHLEATGQARVVSREGRGKVWGAR